MDHCPYYWQETGSKTAHQSVLIRFHISQSFFETFIIPAVLKVNINKVANCPNIAEIQRKENIYQ